MRGLRRIGRLLAVDYNNRWGLVYVDPVALSVLQPAAALGARLTAMEMDDEGTIRTIYSVKVSRYMNSSVAHGAAMRGQPRAQLYFDRPHLAEAGNCRRLPG